MSSFGLYNSTADSHVFSQLALDTTPREYFYVEGFISINSICRAILLTVLFFLLVISFALSTFRLFSELAKDAER